MATHRDTFLTALAPAIWGSTYIVTSEMLPQGYPLTMAMLRALPAGLILLFVVRALPGREWFVRVALLGALNFTIFWSLLFIAAYRLPGGVAATLGALQVFIAILLARGALGTPIRLPAIATSLSGILGVALLVLGPDAALDPLGLAAGLGGALSMAAGTVFSRKWQPPVSAITFTAWQLTAGGLMLVPLSLVFEPTLPPLTGRNMAGLAWLGLIGAALTYLLWFRGVARIAPAAVSMLGLLSPLTAIGLGWLLLGQALTPLQTLGATTILAAVWASQRANLPGNSTAQPTDFKKGKPTRLGSVKLQLSDGLSEVLSRHEGVLFERSLEGDYIGHGRDGGVGENPH